MPHSSTITIIDLKKEKLETKKFVIFSHIVQTVLHKISKTNENVIIFINRKALATSVICQDCGYVIKCPNCDVPLTFHQENNQTFLLCHHCGYQTKPPQNCPVCKSHKLITLGLGTERLDLELKQMGFNSKLINILEGDLNDKIELEIIQKFNEKKIKILIATEAIFRPQLLPADYIIVPNIDNLLFFPDFQNEERIFNTLLKLRKLSKQQIFIQTINPNQKIITYFVNNKIKEFYQEELQWRQIYNWPPFSQVIKLTLITKNSKTGEQEANRAKDLLAHKIDTLNLQNKIQIIGPVPAFIFKEKNKYRFNILFKIRYNKLIDNTQLHPIYSLNILEPVLTKEELLLRNKILTLVPSSWQIDVNPKTIL